jgi:hypothetical protein
MRRGSLEFAPENASTVRTGNLMAQIHVERTIAAPPERVFDWLLDPANLTVSPVFRKAVWAKDSSGPGVGAVREVTGFGFWAHERITAYDAPRSCSYVVVGAFPATQHEGGTLTCAPSGDGHACRLGKRLHASGSRGWQGNRGNHLAAGPLAYLPRNSRWLREGTRELVRATTQSGSKL